MATITFGFADPQPGGVDRPIVGATVRCALLEPDVSAGVYRSVREFPVPMAGGVGEAVLSAGVWRVTVDGVEGVVERYVQVPGEDGRQSFASLPDVDPSSIVMTPETLPVWQGLAAEVEQLRNGGSGVTYGPGLMNFTWFLAGPLTAPRDLAARVSTPPVGRIELIAASVAVRAAAGLAVPPSGSSVVRFYVDGTPAGDIPLGAREVAFSLYKYATASNRRIFAGVPTLGPDQRVHAALLGVPDAAVAPEDLTATIWWRWQA